MTAPKATAVVVNYNAAAHLAECVRSLRADGFAEIVVADNASTDDSAAVLRGADPAARFLPTGANLGFGAAANRAMAATTGDLVAICNPDVVVEPGTAKTLVEALERDPGLAVVAPRIETLDGRLYPSARRFPAMGDAIGHAFLHYVWRDNPFTRRYRMLDWDHASARDVDWVSGTFLMVRREDFERIGGFDESFFMYVEDVDLCWRFWQAGRRVRYEPGGRVIHAIGASSELTPYRMIVAHHRSLLRFATKTHGGARRLVLPFVAAGLALRTALACAQRAARRRPPAAL